MTRIPQSTPLAWLRVTLRQLARTRAPRRFDPTAEAAFQRFYASRNYAQARFGVALGCIAWCSFALWDVLEFPWASGPLLMVRLLLIAPIIGGLWWFAAARPNTFRARIQRYLLIGQLSTNFGLLLLVWIIWKADPAVAFQRFFPAFMGVSFFQYVFLGMQFNMAVMLGGMTLAAVSVLGFLSGMPIPVVLAMLLQLVMLNFLGLIVCARNEIHQRALFRLHAHHLRQVELAQEESANARWARDDALVHSQRAEAAMNLVQVERAKLAAAIEEKEQFLSAAYHDLQQPLSVIGLYLRLAKSKLGDGSTPGIQPELAVIEGAAQDIAIMFKGVRDTCEIGRSEPNIEPVDLNGLFDEITREWGARASEKGLVLRVSKRRRHPFFVLSDRRLLKRAISNLVGNAIKYTEHGGVILAAVRLQSCIRIDVQDTGIGIPEEFQTRIFDEYFRIEQAGRDRRRGLGLGLFIVRRIEESLPRHRLSFRSRPGQGSRFSLKVPATAGRESGASASVALPTTSPVRDILQGKYVVVVEDERLILDSLIEALRHAGCLVEGVESAEAARILFADRDRCPDILVTDYQLRCGETALEVIGALCCRFEWAIDTPVLFVTGELLTRITVPSDFKGLYDVYHKPIDAEVLLRRLCHLIMSHCPGSRLSGGSVPEARRKLPAQPFALRDASGSQR